MTWGWIDGSDRLTVGGRVIFVAWGIAGVLGLYCWWFFERQEWSELRRAYRFRTVEPQDDEEVAAAKRFLLNKESSSSEREQAVHVLLSRGACSLNTVSVAREALGYVVAFGVLSLIFLLLVWLT